MHKTDLRAPPTNFTLKRHTHSIHGKKTLPETVIAPIVVLSVWNVDTVKRLKQIFGGGQVSFG